jgi:hypothetical protein
MSALRTAVIVAAAAALGYWDFAAAYLVGVVAAQALIHRFGRSPPRLETPCAARPVVVEAALSSTG